MITEGCKIVAAGSGWLAQLVRAPALHAGCRGFESLTAHHLTKQTVDSKCIHIKTNDLRGIWNVRRERYVRLIAPCTALLPYKKGRTLQS